MRRPGIEPGSTAWKAAMLTIIPPTRCLACCFQSQRCLGKYHMSCDLWRVIPQAAVLGI